MARHDNGELKIKGSKGWVIMASSDRNFFVRSAFGAELGAIKLKIQRPTRYRGCVRCSTALPISLAEARTETVNPKNGPKSCDAGMLVMNSPGTDV